MPSAKSNSGGRYEIGGIVWAVNAASRMPGTTCLVRSIAASRIMNRYGYPANVAIGVRRNNGEPFGAHAWVEVENKAVMNENGEYVLLQ